MYVIEAVLPKACKITDCKNKVKRSGGISYRVKWKKSGWPTNTAKREWQERTKIKGGDKGTEGGRSGTFWCVLCLFCIYFFALSSRVRFTIVTSLVANKDFKRPGSFANYLLLDAGGVVLCVGRGGGWGWVGGSLWSEWMPTTALQPGVALAWQQHFQRDVPHIGFVSLLRHPSLILTCHTAVLHLFGSCVIFFVS